MSRKSEFCAGKKTGLLMALVAGAVSLLSCERDVQRSGDGDQSTSAVTEPLPGRQRVETGDNANSPGSLTEEKNTRLPHDEKGDVGSSYASNINPATEGRAPKIAEDVVVKRTGQASIGNSLDVAGFGFERRRDFKDLMKSRLDSLDRNIDQLRQMPVDQGNTGVGSRKIGNDRRAKGVPNLQPQIARIEKDRDVLVNRIDDVDDVKKEQWDTFKTKFRDDVYALERSYQDFLTTAGK